MGRTKMTRKITHYQILLRDALLYYISKADKTEENLK